MNRILGAPDLARNGRGQAGTRNIKCSTDDAVNVSSVYSFSAMVRDSLEWARPVPPFAELGHWL